MKTHQKGRSMVEMLGVLAIIGVLSAGALAGYSKAMFKHNLNRQRTELQLILNGVITNMDRLGDMPDGFITSAAIQMGIIPREMVQQGTVLGRFQTQYYIERVVASGRYKGLVIHMYSDLLKSSDGETVAICENIVSTVKAYAQDLYVLENHAQHDDGIYYNSFAGDRYCSGNCIATATMSQIQAHCANSKDATGTSRHMIWFIFDK